MFNLVPSVELKPSFIRWGRCAAAMLCDAFARGLRVNAASGTNEADRFAVHLANGFKELAKVLRCTPTRR